MYGLEEIKKMNKKAQKEVLKRKRIQKQWDRQQLKKLKDILSMM